MCEEDDIIKHTVHLGWGLQQRDDRSHLQGMHHLRGSGGGGQVWVGKGVRGVMV